MDPANSFRIAHCTIGRDHPPFVIAEMSGNHNHSLNRAMAIVEAVAQAGAHAIKFQTYTADTMTIDAPQPEFQIRDAKSLWNGSTLYSLYEEAHTPWDWHEPLFRRARELGVIPFSTPFDETAVDLLESLDVPCYKIASFENTDLPLIRRVAATGKPLIISTGMATLSELEEMVKAARSAGCRHLVLLKCTSNYPATPVDTNITTIPHMRQLFGCEIGLSDHTMGVGVSVASVALGATVIEKHFTLARADGGVDSAFSLEPAEMRQLVEETARAWQGLGRVTYGPTVAEKSSMQFRRSLYVVQDLKAGEAITPANVRAIRPGLGLAPRHFEEVMGRVALHDAPRGTPVSWSLLR